MIQIKRITVILFLFTTLFVIPVQGKSVAHYRDTFYTLFVQEKIPQWGPILTQMENDAECATLEGRQELLCGYYGYIAYWADKKQNAEAEKHLKTALNLSKQFSKLHPNDARLKALHGNIVGLGIGLSPLRATTQGKGMLSSINEAYKLAPNDTWVSLLYGNIRFYLPSFLGGDKEKGLACYQQALQAMEKDLTTYERHWLYVQLQITIGVVYEDGEKYTQALAVYEPLAKKYPQYGYIKNVLIPRTKQALEQKKK